MNRQQRRKLRRIAETEERNLLYLEDLQMKRMDRLLGLYAVAIGLAHHKLYGKGRDDFIEPLIREWNDQIRRIADEDLTYEDLQEELLKKTGISFIFK